MSADQWFLVNIVKLYTESVAWCSLSDQGLHCWKIAGRGMHDKLIGLTFETRKSRMFGGRKHADVEIICPLQH